MSSPSALAGTAPAHMADSRSVCAPAPDSVIHRIWPVAVIGFAFGLTAAWIWFLGYGLVKLVELAI